MKNKAPYPNLAPPPPPQPAKPLPRLILVMPPAGMDRDMLNNMCDRMDNWLRNGGVMLLGYGVRLLHWREDGQLVELNVPYSESEATP